MPAGKQKTVYFFEPVLVDKVGEAHAIADGFWGGIHDHVASLPEEERRATFRARKIEGEASSTKSPAVDYLYVAKLRPGADWPDIRTVTGEHGTLASTGAVGALLEPAYVVGVTGTNYCAILRSSGGPTVSAIESWLNLVGGFVHTADMLELRPYVRHDQLQRLAAAQGASKVRLKVEPDAFDSSDPSSDIGRAVATAQAAAGGGVTVDMTISFGHVTPDGPAADQLIEGVRDILRSGGVKFASATLLIPATDGGLERDKVDFIKDRVTYVQQVGDSEDEQPTPEIVMTAMGEAIQAFKKQL